MPSLRPRRPARPARPRRRRSAALLLAGGLACGGGDVETAGPTADPSSLRTTPSGDVVGLRSDYGSHAWLGIPYALPPVGGRRWRAPEPAPHWPGTREALAFGPPCVQLASPLGGVDGAEPGTPVGSEDCLTLNVHAPAVAPEAVPGEGAGWPVLVWIHGGGNTIGSSTFYDGGRLAADEQVVVVTLNYRLGPFGWFRHPALFETATAEERSGNFGTLDLIRGLDWVREHAAAFGGDPDNVTVFGESAGGTNVVTLLLAPRARGLFHRAVVQSGSTRAFDVAQASHLPDAPEPGHAQSAAEIALRLLVESGAAPDRETARARAEAMDPRAVAAALRELPAETVLGAYEAGGSGMIDLPRVIRDGVVLPAEPFDRALAAPGGAAEVPVVLGTNRDEMKLFFFMDPERVRRWFGIFPQVLDEERYHREARVLDRLWKATGADEPARALAALGRRDVFVYRFDWDEEPKILWADLGRLIGAGHGLEIPFVFGHWELGREGRVLFDDDNAEGREALSRAMRSYWARFAATGDPATGRGGDLPRWTAWDPAAGAPKFLVLDTPAGGGPRMADEVVTVETVVAEVQRDAGFATREARCAMLAMMAERSPARPVLREATTDCDAAARVASE